MKKLLTILMALLVAAAFVTGCTNNDNVEDDVEVNTEVETPADDETEVETPVDDETPVEDETPVDDKTENNEELPEVPELPVQPEVETPVEDEAPVVDETPVEDETPAEDEIEAPAADSLMGIMDRINAEKPVELMLMPMELDLTDLDGLKYFTGLDSADKIDSALVCEPMIGSIAYSSVLVRVKDAADAADVAEAMKNGIDQRKWMCVEADDLSVATSGDLVYLFMIDTEYADTVTSAQMMEAFNTVCAG